MTQDIDLRILAKLAREMAMLIKPESDILAAYGLSEKDFERIRQIEFYRRTFEAAVIEWNKPMSSTERLQAIGRAYVEELMPPLAGRAASGEDPLAQSAEVLKIIHTISGGRGGGAETPAEGRERFQITINLGERSEVYDKPLALVEPKAVEHDQRHR